MHLRIRAVMYVYTSTKCPFVASMQCFKALEKDLSFHFIFYFYTESKTASFNNNDYYYNKSKWEKMSGATVGFNFCFFSTYLNFLSHLSFFIELSWIIFFLLLRSMLSLNRVPFLCFFITVQNLQWWLIFCVSLFFPVFMTKLSFTFLACLGIQSNVTWALGAVEQQQQVSAEEVKVALAVVPGFIIVASSSRICQFWFCSSVSNGMCCLPPVCSAK